MLKCQQSALTQQYVTSIIINRKKKTYLTLLVAIVIVRAHFSLSLIIQLCTVTLTQLWCWQVCWPKTRLHALKKQLCYHLIFKWKDLPWELQLFLASVRKDIVSSTQQWLTVNTRTSINPTCRSASHQHWMLMWGTFKCKSPWLKHYRDCTAMNR